MTDIREEKITITKGEYYDLRLVDAKMDLLDAGGVDNWDWYGESLFPEDDDMATLDEIEEQLQNEIFE